MHLKWSTHRDSTWRRSLHTDGGWGRDGNFLQYLFYSGSHITPEWWTWVPKSPCNHIVPLQPWKFTVYDNTACQHVPLFPSTALSLQQGVHVFAFVFLLSGVCGVIHCPLQWPHHAFWSFCGGSRGGGCKSMPPPLIGWSNGKLWSLSPVRVFPVEGWLGPVLEFHCC